MNNGDLLFVRRRGGHDDLFPLSTGNKGMWAHLCTHIHVHASTTGRLTCYYISKSGCAHDSMIAQASKQPFKCQSKCYLTGLIVKHTGSFNNPQINKSALQEEAGAINYLIAALSGCVHRMMDGESWFTLKDILQTSFVTHTSSCALIH